MALIMLNITPKRLETRTVKPKRKNRGYNLSRTLTTHSVALYILALMTVWGNPTLGAQTPTSTPTPEEVKARRITGTCHAISRQLLPALQKISNQPVGTKTEHIKSKTPSPSHTKDSEKTTDKWQLLQEVPEELNCDDLEQANNFIKFVAKFTAVTRNRIGVITIQTSEFHSFNQSIADGLKVAISNIKSGSQHFIFTQTPPDITAIEKVVADLVLDKQVSSIILTGPPSFLNLPIQLLNALMVPTLVASPFNKRSASMSYIFKVFPSQEELTARLFDEMKERDIKKIALLRPMSGKSDSFLSNIKGGAQKHDVTVTQEVIYNPQDYQSILAAGQRLLQIDTTKRAKEYETLYKEQQEHAQKEGVKFDPRFVILPPIIEFDAVILPDHFKAVRYFAKVFKYLGVKTATFIGSQEWRAAGLIEPFDTFLTGSFFADFIGSYLDLPAGIRGNLKNKNFAPVDQASKFDLQNIGYKTGQLAAQQLKLKFLRRTHVSRFYRNLKQRIWGTSSTEPLFNSDQTAKWKAHILTVKESDLDIK